MPIQQMLLGVGAIAVQNYSVEFDGNGDTLFAPNSSDYSFGSGDFTVEGWFNIDQQSSQNGIIGVWGYSVSRRSWLIQTDNSSNGPLEFYISPDGGNGSLISCSGGTVALNQWYHFAAVRDGSTLRLFLNGTQVDTSSIGVSPYNNTNDDLHIGSVFNQTDFADGEISNIRITQGQALYTSAFTPSTEALTTTSQSATESNVKLLCCNQSTVTGVTKISGRITNDGATASTDSPFSSGNSVDFDGSNDKVSVPDNTDFEFGSGDFTVEAWIKQSNAAGSGASSHTIVNKWHNTGGAKEWILRIDNGTGNNVLQFLHTTDGDGNIFTTGNAILSTNTWYHVAVVGHSGTIKLFVNGTQESATSSQGTINAYSNELIFGYNKSTNGQWMDGKISNCRITKGQALYTSNFTVTTTALTTTSQSATASNVKLLCLNKSTVTGFTKLPSIMTTSGDPASSTGNPF